MIRSASMFDQPLQERTEELPDGVDIQTPGQMIDAAPPISDATANRNPDRREQKRRWTLARTAFRDAQLRMAAYEIDPALAIDYPAFNDVSVPEVKAMIGLLKQATHLQDASDKEAPLGGSKDLLIDFESAVHAFALAVDLAERAARRLRWSHLPPSDRKHLERIQSLLTHAMSSGNTDEARHNYYAQLQRSVRRLNDRHGVPVIPVRAMTEIEARAQLAIGRG